MKKKTESIQMLEAFKKAGKRVHVLGNTETGVIIALDMEGRIFTVLNGEILNRVNFEAINGQSTRILYLNPGGDGLWPAPEGTSLGYQYATGEWRVPPGLRSARYLVTESTETSATITAEVDLINNLGLGVPAIFMRQISIESDQKEITVHVTESINYIGHNPLTGGNYLLAPWTLCQFDCGSGCEVVFPCKDESAVWDLYDQANKTPLIWEQGICIATTNGTYRYQIGIGEEVPWIEFRDPRRNLVVHRKAELPPAGYSYIDIRDASPNLIPDSKGVRYSVYSDDSGFMEIEAVGGCPAIILPGSELKVAVCTRFTKM
jgi:hypothetical protein